jgi:phosphoribosyl 1,2-cyclic phosphodiesterase
MVGMRVTILASGSKGNCSYVEGENGALLIDAGLSAKAILHRLEDAGGIKEQVRAILVTHEHTDHIRGVDVLARRLGVPVVATKGTWVEFQKNRRSSSKPIEYLPCTFNQPLDVGDFSIHAFQTFHDACQPCGFCIRENDLSVGCCTDTGRVTDKLLVRLRQCDALILESNHCTEMLENGPYPTFLKRRIRSEIGHLSNADAALCLKSLADDLHAVALAHLSEVNNTPEKAIASASEGLGLYRNDVSIHIGRQDALSDTIEV